jgi:hypothetical protein
MSMKTSRLVAAAAAAMAFGVMFPAFSQGIYFDGKVVPGVECYRTSGGTLSTYLGTLMNSHTSSSLNLMCPLLKSKKLTAGPEWQLGMVQVSVHDRHPDMNASCKRYSEYISGSNAFFDDDVAGTEGIDNEATLLGFDMTDPIYDYDYVKCTLPPRYDGNHSHLLYVAYRSVGAD